MVPPRRSAADLGGTGLSWRPAFSAELLERAAEVGFIEVVAEACFAQPALELEVQALAEVWPVVLHSIHMSLGSAEGIDMERAQRLGRLARAVRAVAVTEHIAFTRAGGVEIGHLTPLPRTQEAVDVLAANSAALAARLPVPLWLENIAAPFAWPDDDGSAAFDDGSFATAVAEATGCPLLLDVANLAANALNAGADPGAALQAFPLHRVALVHLAGGRWHDGFYLDTHADPLDPALHPLLSALGAAIGPVPLVLERDHHIPPMSELLDELGAARQARDLGAAGRPFVSPVAVPGARPGRLSSSLAARQADLARALVDADAAAPAGFEPQGLVRARQVLHRKRSDDALGLLPRLGHRRTVAESVVRGALLRAPRPQRSAPVRDAIAIARAALEEHGLRADAEQDLLWLEARFVDRGVHARVEPRRAPWLRVARIHDVGRVVVWKGLGAGAPVHMRRAG